MFPNRPRVSLAADQIHRDKLRVAYYLCNCASNQRAVHMFPKQILEPTKSSKLMLHIVLPHRLSAAYCAADTLR